MSIGDLMILEDMFGSSGGGGLGNLGSFGYYLERVTGFLSVISIIFLIGLIAAAWAFVGFTRRNIGRKMGLQKDWMAFVPFARTIYLLQMLGEQWWKMFFLEYIWLYPPIILWFFTLFNNPTMWTFGWILATLYFLAMIGYKLYYRNKFYKAFGIKSEFALGSVTMWGFFFLRRTFECIIAYTDLLQYGAAARPRGLGEIVRQEARPAPMPGQPQMFAGCSMSGLSGMYAGQELPMAPNDDLVIGRDATFSNIIIDQNADKVSRKHCVVRFDPSRNTYFVTDFSTNGTFIDGGSRIPANVPTPMQRGTIIALGNRENRFRLN